MPVNLTRRPPPDGLECLPAPGGHRTSVAGRSGFCRSRGGAVIAAKSTATGSSKPRRTRAGVTAPPGPPDPANSPPATDNPVARQFAIEAARALADDRCHQIAILDVAGLSPVTDFFV